MRMRARFGLATAFLLVIPTFVQAQRAAGNFGAATGVPAARTASAPVAHAAASPNAVAAGASAASAGTPARMHTGNRVASQHHPVRVAGAGSTSSSNGAGSGFATNNFGANNIGANNFEAIGAGGDPLSVQQILNPVPGFGFDYEHLSAIHRDDNIKAFIDPATQARLASARRRLRRAHLPSNGFVLLDGGGAYAIPADDLSGDANADQTAATDDGPQPAQAEQQQPIIIIQQAAAPAQQQGGGDQQTANAQNFAPAAEEAPLRDVGEFTLVLVSGREIETVAFTRANDRIVYITAEGGRRTLAVGELDIDATVRLNQERGTPLQLPL